MSKDSRPHYTTPVRNLDRSDCETLIRLALAEDAPAGDPTSESIFDVTESALARVVSREAGVFCGKYVVRLLCELDGETHSPRVVVESSVADGKRFEAGATLTTLSGPLPHLLRLERIVLNFLQYLSGISTTVSQAVRQAGPDIAILDTRKTLPGYRRLAKYAVYCGGGTNHRIHLSDMAMIKDNHVSAAGGITQAVQAIRSKHPTLPLEVEVDNLDQLREALSLSPQVILLDNMDAEQVRAAMKTVETSQLEGARRVFVEVSGGWTPDQLSDLHGLSGIGVSMGYLTHTTRFLDLSLELE